MKTTPQELFGRIEMCDGCGDGKKQCFGKAARVINENTKSVVLKQESCKIMVVTEQPLEDSKGLLEKIEEEKFLKTSTPARLNNYFGGKFYSGLKNGRIYWTHYIKCIGSLRGKNSPKKPFDKDACAKEFLEEEINVFKPELIVAVGSNATNFLLRESEPKLKWIELIKRELDAKCENKPLNLPIINDAEIFTLVHPSGRNPASFMNDYVKDKLKELLDKHL